MPQGTANLWRGETISLPRCHLTFHFIFAVIAGDIWEGCPAVPGGGQGRGSQCCWGKARRGGPPPLHRTALPAIVGAGWEWGGRGGVGGWLCQPSDGKKRKCHQNGIAALGEGGGGGGSVPWGEPGGAGSFHRLLPAPSQDRSGSVHLSQPPPLSVPGRLAINLP